MSLSPDFILGLGMGLIVAVVLMTGFAKDGISNYELEEKARDLGMVYPQEMKAQDFYEEAAE